MPQGAWRVSLTVRWLPQFDFVSFGFDSPGKLAVLRLIDLVEDVAAFRFERRDHRVKVFNAVVDHERRFAWSKLVAFLRTDGPDGRSACGLAIRVGPGERGTAPLLDIDSEMTLVPSLQCRCILCLEKDAADASDSLHVNLGYAVLGWRSSAAKLIVGLLAYRSRPCETRSITRNAASGRLCRAIDRGKLVVAQANPSAP